MEPSPLPREYIKLFYDTFVMVQLRETRCKIKSLVVSVYIAGKRRTVLSRQ